MSGNESARVYESLLRLIAIGDSVLLGDCRQPKDKTLV